MEYPWVSDNILLTTAMSNCQTSKVSFRGNASVLYINTKESGETDFNWSPTGGLLLLQSFSDVADAPGTSRCLNAL